MSHEPLSPVSDAERQVLQALWERGPSSVRELHAWLRGQGQDWARTTVITLLQRLEGKGYVAADKSGHAFWYHATVTRDELVRRRMGELADDLCGGEWAPLLLAFTERSRLSDIEIAELQKLVDELSKRRAKSAKKSKNNS
jgi:BlaI family penicillinase repressor